jgi:hypothetical protein
VGRNRSRVDPTAGRFTHRDVVRSFVLLGWDSVGTEKTCPLQVGDERSGATTGHTQRVSQEVLREALWRFSTLDLLQALRDVP